MTLAYPRLRKSVLALFLVLICALGSLPAASQKETPLRQPAPKAMEGFRYILANTQHNGMPYILNLADPKQYAYVMDALDRDGLTSQNRPELYRSIRRAQRQHFGPPVLHPAYAGKTTAIEANAGVSALEDVPPNPQNTTLVSLLNDESMPQIRQYVARSLASVYGGAFSIVTMVNMAATLPGQDPTIFATGQFTQSQPNVPIFQNKLPGTLPSQFPIGTTVVANAITMVYLTPDTVKPITISSTWDDAIDPTDACLTAPTYKAQQGTGKCVNKGTIKPPLEVCWYRGSPNSCDYYNSDGQPTDFVFPLSGNATLPSSIYLDKNNNPTGYMTLALTVASGGGCVLKSSTGAGLVGFTVNGKDNKVLNWSFKAADFPNKDQCLARGGVITDLYFNAIVLLLNGGYASFMITSDASHADTGAYIIPQLNIVWGCVAEGTMITMADGSEHPIEWFEGQKGLSVQSGNGVTRSVADLTKGTEPEMMYVVSDDHGHSVKLTQSHPVFTQDGIRAARDLRKGDVVKTLNGNARITDIHEEQASKLVYNLRLEGQETDESAAMYANGILVGDVNLQRRLDAQAKLARPEMLSAAEILRRVPERWRADFLNILEH